MSKKSWRIYSIPNTNIIFLKRLKLKIRIQNIEFSNISICNCSCVCFNGQRDRIWIRKIEYCIMSICNCSIFLVANAVWVPCFYALMPSNSHASYTRLYQMMDKAMAGQGLAFHPDLPSWWTLKPKFHQLHGLFLQHHLLEMRQVWTIIHKKILAKA